MAESVQKSHLAALYRRFSGSGAVIFCILAGLCATWLSGLNFPEQNNRWHIPIVLDFAGSVEGPHDEYSRSFANFISLFWLGVRLFTTETNIETVFISLQLAGNALLACSFYALIRQSVWQGVNQGVPEQSRLIAALITGFLCFCYGLWGATSLGYSEIFTTYATHTQYSVILCLFALALIMARRPFMAALLLGLCANINLFMGIWGAMAAGFALVMGERRLLSRAQIGFSLIFLILALPLAIRGLWANGGSGAIPFSFYREFLAGHAYGFDYPRALVQTFALGLAAMIATWNMNRPQPFSLPILLASSLAVLVIGIIVPYIADIPLLALLHPLRFTSILIPLTAIGAASLFIQAWRNPADGRLLFAALAVAGFMLKSPIVTIFGFALLVQKERPAIRISGIALTVIALLAIYLPAPEREVSDKAGLAFLLICLILSAVSLIRPAMSALPTHVAALAVTALAAMPVESLNPLVIPLVVACVLAAALPRWQGLAGIIGVWSGAVAGAAAIVLMVLTMRDDPMQMAIFGAGTLLVIMASMLGKIPYIGLLARIGLVALVPALMGLGLMNAVKHGFSTAPTEQQRDFTAAQYWAKENVAPDAMFMPLSVDDGFSLLSRRPIWWEHSYKAAILWQPSLYFPLSRREKALARASTPQQVVNLAKKEKIPYIITNIESLRKIDGIAPVYENRNYAIIKL